MIKITICDVATSYTLSHPVNRDVKSMLHYIKEVQHYAYITEVNSVEYVHNKRKLNLRFYRAYI